MPRSRPFRGPRPGRILGLYALAVMDRDGPIYGYSLAERVSSKTEGAWRPAAGAVYPALQALVTRGLARSGTDGRRRVYRITAAGRAFLGRIRRGWMSGGAGGPDLGLLWSEIAGEGDPGQHLLRHLRRHLDGIAAYAERNPDARAGATSFREQILAELDVARARVSAVRPEETRSSERPRRAG